MSHTRRSKDCLTEWKDDKHRLCKVRGRVRSSLACLFLSRVFELYNVCWITCVDLSYAPLLVFSHFGVSDDQPVVLTEIWFFSFGTSDDQLGVPEF